MTLSNPSHVAAAGRLAADTLITNPPAAISPTLSLLGWLDERIDWVRRILPFA